MCPCSLFRLPCKTIVGSSICFLYCTKTYLFDCGDEDLRFVEFLLWQSVAIKQLDRSGGQGIREFIVEVMTLGSVDHPNLVKLIGFCAEGDQRLLVYEFMPLGSLDDHLHGININPIFSTFSIILNLESSVSLFLPKSRSVGQN